MPSGLLLVVKEMKPADYSYWTTASSPHASIAAFTPQCSTYRPVDWQRLTCHKLTICSLSLWHWIYESCHFSSIIVWFLMTPRLLKGCEETEFILNVITEHYRQASYRGMSETKRHTRGNSIIIYRCIFFYMYESMFYTSDSQLVGCGPVFSGSRAFAWAKKIIIKKMYPVLLLWRFFFMQWSAVYSHSLTVGDDNPF